MNTIQFSILLAMGLVGMTVLGIVALDSDTSSLEVDQPQTQGKDYSADFAALRKEIQLLTLEVQQIKDSYAKLDDKLSPVSIASANGSEGSKAVPALNKADLKMYVAQVLDNQKEIEREEREQQREEMRTRMEERRKEYEEMQKGPYDRYNLKVNSLGKVLNLNDSQKQSYFDLATAYRTKMEEDIKAIREQREQENQANGEEGSRRRRGGDWGRSREEYRKVTQDLQTQFQADLANIFTQDQLDAYGKLSSDSRSFYDRDQVRTSGSSSRGSFTRGGGSFSGRGGSRGGSGRRGGR